MKRTVSIAVLSTVLMGLPGSAADDQAVARDGDRQRDGDGGNLVGLWEGVDLLDGSTVRISIGDLDGDRVLDFRWHESFFSGCLIQQNQGRGIVAGTVNRKSATEFELVATTFVCFDALNNAVDQGLITVEVRYSRKDDILIRIGTDQFPGFILHRTSSIADTGPRD